jgi:hypothetical protein
MAGSGRGNKGINVIDDPNRPECHKCGGFMKSDGVKRPRWRCTSCNASRVKSYQRLPPSDVLEQEQENRWGYDTDKAEAYVQKILNSNKKRYVITSAQNNTEPFQAFLESLHQYCDHINAELLIVPSHYKNLDAWNKEDEKCWDPAVEPYLVHGDIQLGHVLVRASVKIEAPAINPLAGKQAHGGNNWVVFGHPQHAMEPVATAGQSWPKRLYTTGSCTKRNYSVSDRGEKARFNHLFGALVVDGPFVRMVSANSHGKFYDLDCRASRTGVTTGHTIESLVTGDEHVKFNTVSGPTYTHKKSIVNVLKPKYIVRHDVLDGYAGSHHHQRDPLTEFRKHHSGDNDYRAELEQCVKFINDTTPSWATTLIVPSNHHDHLKKWLDTADLNKDHTNALLICELNHKMRDAALKGEETDPFYLYSKEKLTCKHKFLDRNEAFMIGDVDHTQHGDVGVNGSRGSARSFANVTYKVTIGHSHGARVVKGVFQVGVSTGKLEYERGLSDHSNSHVIQYKDGKRTHIDIIDGKWR